MILKTPHTQTARPEKTTCGPCFFFLVGIGTDCNLPSRTPATARGAALKVVATISGHRRRGLADGEQRVALHPIRTEPKSTAR